MTGYRGYATIGGVSMAGPDAERSTYERRIRIASEGATWGIGIMLLVTAALPTTDTPSRVGLLLTSFLMFVFASAWFHLVPESAFGRARFTVGTGLTQVIAAVLLMLTGGAHSPYYPFFFFPVLATAFAMRMSGTLVTGAIALVAYVTIVVTDVLRAGTQGELDFGVIRTLGLLSIAAMTALITRTMQETRQMLRHRTDELALQNTELAVARGTALAVARAREREELIRAVFDSARQALGVDRLYLFAGERGYVDGYTVAGEGAIEEFKADTSLHDSPRMRAIASKRTIVVSDASGDPAVSRRAKEQYGFGSGIFVPLVHRGELIGVVAFSNRAARQWSPADVRLIEVVAEASAPAIASFLSFEELRTASARLEGRTKVLESMNHLVDALALAPDEAATAQTAARSLAQGFGLRGATVLLVDPSLALLEPRASAAGATAHPVVTGPMNCPAIRSGRLFEVRSPEEPVICPFMPLADGGHPYTCVPLTSAGEPVGALFLEPGAGAELEEAFLRAASDRVAISVATRRLIETAQRQATTDGLTGLHNRYFLQEELQLLQSLATRHGQAYGVVALDIDGLKQVNDTFGHEMGDLALRGFANVVRRSLRGSDVGVRIGGDEFLILLPQSGLEEASAAAERLRLAVVAQGRSEPHTAVTVSAGVAVWQPGRTAEQVLQAADAMLYAAKRAGKDRVMVEAPAAAVEGGATPA